jgi:hypothetical protein
LPTFILWGYSDHCTGVGPKCLVVPASG